MSPFRPFVLPQRRVCSRAALLTHHSQPTTQYLLSSAAVHESPSTSHKSRLFMDLQPLRRSQKSQLLWNQANPASFAKTPGVGVPRKNRAIESATYSLFFQDPVMTQLLSQSAERAPTQSGWQSEFLGHFFSPLVTRHFPSAGRQQCYGEFTFAGQQTLWIARTSWQQLRGAQQCASPAGRNTLKTNEIVCANRAEKFGIMRLALRIALGLCLTTFVASSALAQYGGGGMGTGTGAPGTP